MSSESLSNSKDAREAQYWDDVARRASNTDLQVSMNMDDAEIRCQIDLLGDLKCKRVLEVGCGSGEWATHLARLGAEVWAVDISPESVALTQRRAEANGVSDHVDARVMSAMAMEFETGFFDIVHGANIIHHLEASVFGLEVARVLKPTGYAVFTENSANNPLLMLARNLLCGRFGIAKWSSQDEYPLTRKNIRLFSVPFRRCDVHYPRFLFFHYFNAKIFHYQNRRVNAICECLDQGIYRFVPLFRQYSYRQIVLCGDPAIAKGQ